MPDDKPPEKPEEKKATVYIISDGTGETAATMIRAALVQYSGVDSQIVRHKNVRNEHQVESLIDAAFEAKAVIVHTMASPLLRDKIREYSSGKGLQAVDLLGPLLEQLDIYFGAKSSQGVGLLHIVDTRYFKRIEAIEYTVKHDDGKTLTDLDEADIILIGISRTSKTPLSIFLSHKGWKVANIPLVLNTPLPQELTKVDQRKIIGLIIDPDSLSRIRRNRLEKFGQDPGGEYARSSYIAQELEYALGLFKQNQRWPVLNVTERALEETATEITRIIASRMGLPDKMLF